MWGFFIAIISGILMSVQGVLNTGASKISGNWLTNSFVQLTAFIVCFAVWFFKEKNQYGIGTLMDVTPKYLLLGGVAGAFITFTVILGMKQLGPAQAAVIIVVSQVIAAWLIEQFGLFGVERTPFKWSRIIGLVIVAIGIIIFKRK